MKRIGALLPLLILTACSGGADDPDASEPSDGATDERVVTSAGSEGPVEVVDAGFGQTSDPATQQYVWLTAVLEGGEDVGGKPVTVIYDVFGEDGERLASTSQQARFDTDGQTIATGTQLEVGRRDQVASVVATAAVVERTEKEHEVAIPVAEADSIEPTPSQEGGWTVGFTIQNPTDEAVVEPLVTAVCWGVDDEIVGGGIDFPARIPAGGQAVSQPYVTLSGEPERCEAYTTYTT